MYRDLNMFQARIISTSEETSVPLRVGSYLLMRMCSLYEGKDQAEAAVIGLRRVGIDRTIGYLDRGMYEWAKAGLSANHVPQLSAEELSQKMVKGNRFSLVDVRARGEFQTGHIEGAINIPAPDLRQQYKNLDAKIPWVVICNTGAVMV